MEPEDSILINEEGLVRPGQITIPSLLRVSDIQPYIDRVLVPRGLIQDRVRKLAEDVIECFGSGSFVCLVVLRGAFRFSKDLIEQIEEIPTQTPRKIDIEFIRAKSYVNNVRKDVTVEGIDGLKLRGKNVLIIEDLIDSGSTLTKVVDIIRNHGPALLKVAVFAFKQNPENRTIKPDFCGFTLPNLWIVGYHVDYNDYFRDLKHLCSLNQEGIDCFRVE